MKLLLNDRQARYLIKVLKDLVKPYIKTISEHGDTGSFMLISHNQASQFKVDYFVATDNIHINMIDYKTRSTLVRINLDSSFHNNSDGKIRGHRVEIFSEQEFREKADGFTHVRAYPLPFDTIKDTDDFMSALTELLDYTNTQRVDVS